MESRAHLATSYSESAPYPHIVIDEFLDMKVYRRLSESFPDRDSDIWYKFKSGRENKKLQSRDFSQMPRPFREIINELNGPSFISWLEDVTGIVGLKADNEMLGGGLHQTLRGGHLGVHIDYNRHPKTKLFRRLNAILYLNDDWKDEWGGDLELWNRDLTQCVQRIAPIGNRLVIFSTSEHSWHGHPDPLLCPADVARRSIALYYYSEEPSSQSDRELSHNTVFKERPGEKFNKTIFDWLSYLKKLIS